MLAVNSLPLVVISFASLSQAHAQHVNIETSGALIARIQTLVYQGLPKVLDSRTTWCGDTTTAELCLAGNDCIDGQCIPNFENTITDPIVYDDPVPDDTSGSWSCSASDFVCPAGLGCCPIGTFCDDIYGKCCSTAMFCGGVCCNTGNVCLGDGVCGIASEGTSTSFQATTSSVLAGSGKSSTTATGASTGSTTTPASGESIGAGSTPATSKGTPKKNFSSLFAVYFAAWTFFC